MQNKYLAIAALLAAANAAAVSQADYARIMPPPGLYSIEADATIMHTRQPLGIRTQRSGATETSTYIAPDQQVTRQLPLDQPETTCVPPRPAKAAPLPSYMLPAVCKNLSETVSGDSLTLVHQCQTGRMSIVFQRLDSTHWQVSHAAEIMGGVPNVTALKPMLEQMARHGASEQERQQAKRMLAELPQRQAALEAQLASIGMKPGYTNQVAMRDTSVQRWTRIADQCQPR
ncbi:hypothetical protein GJ697_15715 [Pseudoduganella sp. FT25W]|uniref:DUF4124 domain-containing protein n=1 Tax=Duganella alba TaxID=2666081 RepID=A0A6L5QI04_9BURK|nr:hypothetical protein [Duganella alba]MRX09290.1 hypothetical protein [Duganella alba]MRX17188.1 hypothetical protein [Duganella alba]